jgi:hypothetical protein
MWSLTSLRAKRISGPGKFRSSPSKDFFNSICQNRKWLTPEKLGRTTLFCRRDGMMLVDDTPVTASGGANVTGSQ